MSFLLAEISNVDNLNREATTGVFAVGFTATTRKGVPSIHLLSASPVASRTRIKLLEKKSVSDLEIPVILTYLESLGTI
jgi:hypothetical protein